MLVTIVFIFGVGACQYYADVKKHKALQKHFPGLT